MQLCIMLFHTSWIFAISKSQSYEYFDYLEYTTPTQSKKKSNPAFLGDKIFRDDKNDNRPIERYTGRIMIKILLSLYV